MVRFRARLHIAISLVGQKQTCAAQKVMSALPPKADMCGATRDVRFVPIADIAGLFDHLVGSADHRLWDIQPERLCGFQVDAGAEVAAITAT